MSITYLSENTRKIRRSLLLVSLIGYAISKLGLALTEVQVFGSKFEFQNYTAIPFVLILVILYFLITFVVYAGSEQSRGFLKAVEDYHARVAQGKSYTPDDIEHSISSLQSEIAAMTKSSSSFVKPGDFSEDVPSDLTRAIAEKTAEIRRLERADAPGGPPILRVPFYARLSWGGLRTVTEIWVPILISVVVIAHLALFTEISNSSLKGEAEGLHIVQPDSINIATDTPVIVDTTDTISGN